jgi:RimJ/RimL family protein N-acetyltransferase
MVPEGLQGLACGSGPPPRHCYDDVDGGDRVLQRNGVTIRPLQLEDLDKLYEWHQDAEIDAWAGWGPRMSRARFLHRYEEVVREPPEDFVLFGVEYGDGLVGYIELAEISRISRRAAIGFVIGEKDVRRHGVATNAVVLMLDYGFSLEDLERIYAEVYPFNQASVRLLEKVGFQHEGTLRRHEVHQGARTDLAVYGILRDEFYGRYSTALPNPGRQ